MRHMLRGEPSNCLVSPHLTSVHQIITRGVACSTPNCKARLHYHCCRKYRSRNAKCPACSQDWPQDPKNMTAVGEEAIKDGQDEGRRVRRKSTEDGSDEEDEEEEMEVEPSQPSQTQTQSQRKRKGKSKGKQKKTPTTMDVDEDEDEEDEADEAPQQTQGNGRRRSTRTR